jgi:MFS transporter, OFA family, oxalate/formate antiporter
MRAYGHIIGFMWEETQMSSIETVHPPFGGRWLQLAIGIVCMAMVANLQYGWTLFVEPIQETHGWTLGAIQVAFSLFVLTETWLVPIEGWFVDRFGPRVVVVAGGFLCGLAWLLNSAADSLTLLYLGAILGGIGAGAVYGTCVANALKWFPDRRGLAAGLTAAGFGAGSALTIVPIANMIASSGYEHTFFIFGLIQGGVTLVLGLFLAKPNLRLLSATKARVMQTRREYSPWEMLKSPVFWVMYAMFVLVAAGGLVVTAQIGPIAKDIKLANVPVSLFGLTMAALPFALAIDRVMNGITRPFFGWVSDHIGRENTMFIAFALEAIGIVALWHFSASPVAFVLLTGVVFFAWGEIYSLFPSTCADTFGAKFAATNSGLLYTAKGTASILVPLANVLHDSSGSWESVFYIAAAVNVIAAVSALLILKPMRAKTMRNSKPGGVDAAELLPAE